MSTILQSILKIIFIVEFSTGSLGNGFIVLVNCVDLVKRRKIASVDQILIALAISRFSLVWFVFLEWFMFMKYSPMAKSTLRMTQIAWSISNHFSNWLATSLSIFYFLKICISSNSLFLYLKWRIKNVVLMTLLISLGLLFLNIFLLNKHINDWFDGSKRNTSDISSSSSFVDYNVLILLQSLMFTLIPFGVSLITFLFLIFSLWKHIKKMQYSMKGYRDVRTLAHITALQTVVAFLLFYITFILSLVVEFWTGVIEKGLIPLFVRVIITIFPSIHPWFFIWGHRKLRQDLLLVLQWLRYWCKHTETLDP